MTTITTTPTARINGTVILGAAAALAVLWLLAGPLGSIGAASDAAFGDAADADAQLMDAAGPAVPLAHRPAVHPAATTEGAVAVALDAAAEEHGVDGSLVRAVAWVESSFRPTVRSDAGAVGIMQLMPATVVHAEELVGHDLDPLDVQDNVHGGAAYLAHLLDRADGDVAHALAAYHQGWTGVMRDGVSSTSAGYVDRVMDLHQQLEGHRSGAWA
ncbi:lytic transglycosylase domain-containing protein [Euzebya pacifica]|uniref:lytic transglycosylase domain-containing protein n=1 Tax=Euzebya pacifica TaxID=1608957 RepID=UPI0030F951C9